MKILFLTLLVIAIISPAIDATKKKKQKCVPVTTTKSPTPQNCTKPNQEFSQCGANGCQNTCADPTFSTRCRGICTAGCVCKAGFLRDDKGNCVTPKACPKPQPSCKKPNEVYSRCGGHPNCAKTCEKPNGGPCPKICMEGCICKEGYLRDSKGNCVLLKHCPAPPPACKKPNEYYTECGPHSGCVATCNKPTPNVCPMICVSGCFCKDGYVRDSKGNCVLLKHCPAPPACLKNEVWKDCSGFCFEENCRNLYGPKVVCRPGPCQPGCVCKEGFYRNNDGHCVTANQCPKPDCKGRNENFSQCVSPCRPTCANPNAHKQCKAACRPNCGCKEGFVYDSQFVNCIPLRQCPQVQPKP